MYDCRASVIIICEDLDESSYCISVKVIAVARLAEFRCVILNPKILGVIVSLVGTIICFTCSYLDK